MAKVSQYRRYTRSTAGNIGYFSILILMSIIMVIPLFYCIVTSFKPLDELLIFPPKFIVERPTFSNYRVLPALLSNLQIPISRYLFNTLLITVVTTIATMNIIPPIIGVPCLLLCQLGPMSRIVWPKLSL